MNIETRIARCQQRVNAVLGQWLSLDGPAPNRLIEAMRYCTLGSGKRIRPLLVYTTGEALGIPNEQLDGPACAVELIHAYSLVHDDLPAMDDDDLRRGKPTCHKAFDEATAILVGDALQVIAFQILATDPRMVADPGLRLRMIGLLAEASGPEGMAGGQAIDLQSAGQRLEVHELEAMHRMKTGALIRASVLLGAMSSPDLNAEELDALDTYARCVGLAFQIRDDILDVEGDVSRIGKATGADQALAKPTYPSILGLEESKRRALSMHEKAVAALGPLQARARTLIDLSAYIVGRDR